MLYRDVQLSEIARGPRETVYQRINAHREKILARDIERIRGNGAQALRDYPGYYISPNGIVYATFGRRLRALRAGVKPGGYEFVGLNSSGASNGRKYEMVHRLVAKTFIPNPRSLPEINHIDGNKRNNRVGNLEWCTHRENYVHMVEMYGIRPGVNHYNCKLNEDQVRAIRAASDSYKVIGRRFGVSAQTVCNVKRRSRYGDVV